MSRFSFRVATTTDVVRIYMKVIIGIVFLDFHGLS